jgi:phosphate-selective porin
MKRAIYFLVCLLCLLNVAINKCAASEGNKVIKKVLVSSGAETFRIKLIASDSFFSYSAFTLRDPARLVIDMELSDCYLPKVYSLNHPYYSQLRWGIHEEKLRIVLDANKEEIPSYKIVKKDNILEIILPLEGPIVADAKKKAIMDSEKVKLMPYTVQKEEKKWIEQPKEVKKEDITKKEEAPLVQGITADELLKILQQKGLVTKEDIEKIKKEQVEREEKALVKKERVPLQIFTGRHLLEFESPSGYFKACLRGYFHFDTRIYESNSGNANTFDVRRARFDFRGTAGKYASFRVQSEMAGDPYLRNAWLDLRYWPWLGVMMGQFKPFFSTQWWTLDNQTIFLERASANPVYPFFDRGVTFYGELFKKTLTYSFGIFTGAGMERDYASSDIDDHKDYTGRLFFTPFKNSKNDWINNLHFVIQGTWGTETVNTKGFENRGLTAQNYQSKIWIWNTDYVWTLGHRYRYGFEVHWIKGPFFISNENLRVAWEDIRKVEDGVEPPSGFSGHTSVYTLFMGYFLTGEQMEVSNWGWKLPTPKHYFNPLKGSWGAFQPTFSYTYTKTSQNMFDMGVLDGASYVHSFILGLNWLWSNMISWHFNVMYLQSGGGTGGIISGDYEDDNDWFPRDQRDDEWMFGMRVKFMM